MEIINIDKDGNIIENPDWTKIRRINVEESFDNDGKLHHIISHCEPISQSELDQQILNECKNNLANTDYISSKLGDALMNCECTDISEIFLIISEFKKEYSEVIAQRELWREEINRINKKMLEEQNE